MVDQARYDQLIKKRGEVGLSDEEANELGRMFAEQAGKPYSNAQGRRGGDAEAAAGADSTGEEEGMGS